MNYTKIYNSLVERAKNRKLTTYKEKHHIIPKCMGGSNKKENLVELTAREHYIAHLLLVKIYPNNSKLKYAMWAMINGWQSNSIIRDYKISSRMYEIIKMNYSIVAKEQLTFNNPMKNELHRKKLSESLMGENHILYGKSYDDVVGKEKADKWRESIRKSLLTSEKWINSMKNPNRGKKISKALSGVKFSQTHIQRLKENHADFSGKNNPRAISVQCIIEGCCDNSIYDTIGECANYHSVLYGTVSSHINNKVKNKKFKKYEG
jgi:hypothetical protein